MDGQSNPTDATTRFLRRLPERVRRLIAARGAQAVLGRRWLLGLVVSLLLALFISPHVRFLSATFHAGEFAERTIVAPRTVVVEDVFNTNQRRQEAAVASAPVFDRDSQAAERRKAQIDLAVERLKAAIGLDEKPAAAEETVGQGSVVSKEDMARAETAFTEALGIKGLSKQDFSFLSRSGHADAVAAHAKAFVDLAAGRRVVGDLKSFQAVVELMPPEVRSIAIRDVATDNETAVSDLKSIKDGAALAKEIEEAARQVSGADRRDAQIAASLVIAMDPANLVLNLEETEKRRTQARDAVVPSMVKLFKNQVIVAEGERITDEKLALINQVLHRQDRSNQLLSFLATFALCFVLLAVTVHFGEQNVRKFSVSARDLLFLSVTSVATVLFTRLGLSLGTAVSGAIEVIPESAFAYALPIAAAAMIVRIILNSETAIVFAAAQAILLGLLRGGDHSYTLFALVGLLAGADLMRFVSKRIRILRAGWLVGLVNAGTVLAVTAFPGRTEDVFSVETLFNVGGAFAGGAISGLVVLAFLPVAELLFEYTSNITLLELASLNHPLLKEMVLRAPGTYNHAFLVSSLAEAGAEPIAANPLLAKVGGLFHDIGKLQKPGYFLENDAGPRDAHEGLAPSMSALILTAHVREGVDLARRFHLGERLISIIREHHGTSLIRSFYEAAKARQDAEGTPVNPDDYRYAGPKPQSREAALVMLANMTEFGCRKLTTPTPARLGHFIEEVINDAFIDGQLAACDMTLADLNRVHAAFLKIMAAHYHSRIEYPEQKPAERKLSLVESGNP